MRRIAILAIVLAVLAVAATATAQPDTRGAPDDQPGPTEQTQQFDVPGDWTIGGQLGLGTESPSQRIDLAGDSTETIQFDPTGAVSFGWFLTGDSLRWAVRQGFVNETENIISLDAAGEVGVGTEDPAASLHVTKNDGSTRVFVDETTAAAARRTLLQLENQGQVAFGFTDTVGGAAGPNTWQFATRGGDAFEINKGGTGGTEMLFRASGRVTMGPGPNTTFDLSPSGNLTITGTLTEGSSRAIKKAIVPVDVSAVLESVRDLQIAEWSYRGDSARHVGPMAEDFYAAFGLGEDGTGLAALDTSGVALAAVQGLDRQMASHMAALEAENARLAAENAELAATTEELARRLADLEAALGG